MVIAYILSVLGMLALQWGVHTRQGGAGILLGAVLLVIALVKTARDLGGVHADKKQLLIYLGIHAAIWVAGALLYEFILGVLIVVGVLIVGAVFFGGAPSVGRSGAVERPEDEEGPGDGYDLSRMPTIVYDDSNRQWKKRDVFGDHIVYYNNDGGEVTIYSGQISGTTANTDAGTFHWY